MLKVSVLDSETQRRVLVEGSLTAPWVSVLESVWRQSRDSHGDQPVVVDISGTTIIDARGKAILTAMICEGAELIGKGVYTEYLVKSLVNRARETACRF